MGDHIVSHFAAFPALVRQVRFALLSSILEVLLDRCNASLAVCKKLGAPGLDLRNVIRHRFRSLVQDVLLLRLISGESLNLLAEVSELSLGITPQAHLTLEFLV